MSSSDTRWENERLRRKSFGLPLVSKKEYERKVRRDEPGQTDKGRKVYS
jgi:hypothetical protein